MGTDIIKKHNFQNAINRVKDYSLKKKKDIEIKSVKTIDEGIFFDTDHEVTGYELNEVIKVIQGHLIDINKRNNETVNEFYEIYQAFNYLDTEYVKGILTTVKGLEKTNNDVRIQQEELKKHHKKLANQNNKLEAHQGEIEGIIENINKTIDILKVFKKEIDCLKHLSDIDRLWSNHVQLQEKVENLSNDLSNEKENLQNYKELSAENIKSIDNIINSYQVKFNNDIKGIQSSIEILNSFKSSLEELDHLKEIDILWKNLYEIQNRINMINKNLKASYIVGGIALVISILEFFIIWS
jgi:DNA repair exonuclease SbcCD ATPase subunit